MYRQHLNRHEGQDTFRGHMPPPFYSGPNEHVRRQYLSEIGMRELVDTTRSSHWKPENMITQLEDTNQSVERGRFFDPDYRHYGDRRWPDDPQRVWENEYGSRKGYRSIRERIQAGENHAGKGPRSYRRSDERILEDLNERFYEDPYLDASDIETSLSSGEVTLRGTVPDRQSKRYAEELAERISGVRYVENRLRIR